MPITGCFVRLRAAADLSVSIRGSTTCAGIRGADHRLACGDRHNSPVLLTAGVQGFADRSAIGTGRSVLAGWQQEWVWSPGKAPSRSAQTLLMAVLNDVLRSDPRRASAAMTTVMRATMRPYPIAVARCSGSETPLVELDKNSPENEPASTAAKRSGQRA